MDIKVDVNDLKPGMYIAELDRPWTDTNFEFQGFLLQSDLDLAELRRQCSYVIVSMERSDQSLFPQAAGAAAAPESIAIKRPPPASIVTYVYDKPRTGLLSGLKNMLDSTDRQAGRQEQEQQENSEPAFRILEIEEEPKASEAEKRQHVGAMKHLRASFPNGGGGSMEVNYYENVTTLTDEISTSRKTHDEVCDLASDLMKNISSQDLSERIDLAMDLMQGIVDSIVRNAYAMDLLSKLKHLDDYSYHHAVDVSVRLIAFGRHLGFPKDQLQLLGLGGLLLDIGRTKLPKEYFKFTGKFRPEELNIVKRHVLYGVEMLNSVGNVPKEVIELTGLHHERYDGSGYPNRLGGEDIGLFGSMAGIVDTYCAIIGDQPHAKSQASASALHTIVGLKGKGFHPGLVDEFVQTIGIYPIGSLVELNSAEVGIVIRQTRMRRLRPTVLVILAHDHKPYPNPHTVDLMYAPKFGDDKELAIRQELPPGSFGIELSDYFL